MNRIATGQIADKALRLLEQHRVLVAGETRAIVAGDSGRYVVTATRDGVTCTCPARPSGRCAHAAAAMVSWQEEGHR